MKIGIQQSSLGEIGLTKCFSTARVNEIEGLGLCYNSMTQAEELSSQFQKHVTLINSLQKSYKVVPTGLYLGCLQCFESIIGTNENYKIAEKIIKNAISAAFRMKCDTIILPFLDKNKIEFSSELSRACEILSTLAKMIEDYRITIALLTSLTSDQAEIMLGNIGSDYVKLCFDVGTIVACHFDASSMLRRLGREKIAQVFLRDVWCNPNMPPEFNVRLGRGAVPLTSIAQALKAIKYDGWIVLDTPPGDKSNMILKANIEFVRQLLCKIPPEKTLQ